MNIKILGTGTSIPSLKRLSSSYLVTIGDYRILIDAGPSVVRRLLEFGFTVEDIDLIIITHFHVDHTADLSTFLFACNYGIKPRQKPLTIIGGPGFRRFFKGLSKIYPWIMPNYYDLYIKVMSMHPFELNDITITARSVNHNRESIAVRIDAGKSVVFSGDTSYSKRLIELAKGVDLMITECSFPERKVKGHLNLANLARIIEGARPKRVILSHLYPDWDDFKGVLHEPYLLAEDGMEIRL